MAIMVGTGRGATSGILIKNAEALEQLERVDTIVLDKTGTLTEGKPSLTATVAAPGYDEAEVLRLAAAVEHPSEHPLAAAIVRGAKDRQIEIPPVEHFDSITGKGVRGVTTGKAILLGTTSLLAESHIDASPLADAAEKLRAEGQTVK